MPGAIKSAGAVVRFALAHHPTCTTFRADVWVVRWGARAAPLCVGCVAFWPTLCLGALVLPWALPRSGVAWWAAVLLGGALATLQFASYAGRARGRASKTLVKGALGLAGASVAVGLLLAPWPAPVRIGAVAAVAVAAALMQTLRFRKIAATCLACPWRKDWQFCPGFAPLNDHQAGSRPPRVGDEGAPSPWPWHAPAPRDPAVTAGIL